VTQVLEAVLHDAGLARSSRGEMVFRHLHLCFTPPSFDGADASFPPTALPRSSEHARAAGSSSALAGRPARPSRGPGNHRHRVSPHPRPARGNPRHTARRADQPPHPHSGSSKTPRAWERCLCDGQSSCCSPTWSLRGRLFLGFFGVRGRRRILRHRCPRQQGSRPRPRPRSSGRRSCALPASKKELSSPQHQAAKGGDLTRSLTS
jgi:hypothetical protein